MGRKASWERSKRRVSLAESLGRESESPSRQEGERRDGGTEPSWASAPGALQLEHPCAHMACPGVACLMPPVPFYVPGSSTFELLHSLSDNGLAHLFTVIHRGFNLHSVMTCVVTTHASSWVNLSFKLVTHFLICFFVLYRTV